MLANRLSESGCHNVLLLEAGGRDTSPWIHIPLGYGKLFTDPKVNWLYTNEPDPAVATAGSGSLVYSQLTFGSVKSLP